MKVREQDRPGAARSAAPRSELRILYPGRPVPLASRPDDPADPLAGVVAKVYPLGIRHLETFSRDIAGAVVLLGREWQRMKSMNEGEAAAAEQFAQRLVPFVLQNALGLLRDCVRINGVRLADASDEELMLPHWCFPRLVEAWIEESFGSEERWRPWVEAIEGLIERYTGRRTPISAIFFRLSSPPATESGTSSTDSSQVSHTGGGPYPS